MTAPSDIRRVAVLGSSISMVVRPPEGVAYPHVLQRLLNERRPDDLWLVSNLSRVAATVDDAPLYLQQLVAERPEAIVLHYGHVEAVLRPQTRAAWHRTYGIIIGESRRGAAVRAVRKYAGARRRLGLRKQWTPPDRFQRMFNDSLRYLRKETGAALIVLEANPGDQKIETWGPGSLAEIARYNDMMRDVAAEQGAAWMPLDSFLPGPIEEFIPDGTHFTPEAHVALASALADAVLAGRPRV
jgi:lysophospholipase L1-like esterase